jgi:hypothetical protein
MSSQRWNKSLPKSWKKEIWTTKSTSLSSEQINREINLPKNKYQNEGPFKRASSHDVPNFDFICRSWIPQMLQMWRPQSGVKVLTSFIKF